MKRHITSSTARFARLAALAAILAVTTACSGMQAREAQPSLYERLGGQPALVAVVDDFVANVAADQRINRFFANTDIPRLKRLLVEQLCAGTGGPCEYTGRSMKAAHAGMGVRDSHFAALVEDLVKTLNKFEVPAAEQQELLAILGPMQGDIVESGY